MAVDERSEAMFSIYLGTLPLQPFLLAVATEVFTSRDISETARDRHIVTFGRRIRSRECSVERRHF